MTLSADRLLADHVGDRQISGKSRDYVREMMAGADALVSNRRKQYMAGDVAERIMERRQ